MQVPSSNDVWQELAGNGETGKNNTVGVVRVQGREPVRLNGTERVANVDDFGVRRADFWNTAVAELGSHSVEGLNFGLSLNLVERVAVGRVANTETVNSERAVASRKSIVDVAVVVVVVAQIPIAAELVSTSFMNQSRRNLRLVEPDTVAEKLDLSAAALVWLAVLSRDFVASLQSLVALE
jgi:hypothetical protein